MNSTTPMTGTDHQVDVSRSADPLDEEPDDRRIQDWITASLAALDVGKAEVSVRIVSQEEITQLNLQYRSLDRPTNVLSFESGMEIGDGRLMLGDIVICSQVVKEESQQFEKSFHDRYAHMVVHGLLHLLGYDHLEDDERAEMEARETQLLSGFGIVDPYLSGGYDETEDLQHLQDGEVTS